MLPNLIIIGGAKCGTTSLHHYLGLHPAIQMSRPKELNFFVVENNWVKGQTWYESRFRSRSKTIRGEASPHYTRYPVYRGVPERMHALIPHAKLIYLLRDPMERLISQLIDDFSSMDTWADVRSALLPFEDSSFVTPSLQGLQLQQYLPFYDLSQILLVHAEDLSQKRAETMRTIFQFLGVDETFTSKNFALELNPRSVKRERKLSSRMMQRFLAKGPGRLVPYRVGLPIRHWMMRASAPPQRRPTFDSDLEAQLLETFHEDAQRLRKLSGLKLERWRV